MHSYVRDVMTANVVTVRADTSYRDVVTHPGPVYLDPVHVGLGPLAAAGPADPARQ
jgi:hypothetical protein